VVRSTHLLLQVENSHGATYAQSIEIAGFPTEVRLRIELLLDDGSRESGWVTIPIKLSDALGIPPVKRLFLPPTEDEMATTASQLAELERRLEED
jgi:hypothetical protein